MTVQELISKLEDLPTEVKNYPVYVEVWDETGYKKEYVNSIELTGYGVELETA